MHPASQEIHLDPLLPLVVRRDPLIVPPPSAGSATGVFVCLRGEARLAGSRETRSVVAPGILRVSLENGVKVVRKAADSWMLVLGGRLIDELVVAAFGEPGFSRFIEELDSPGSSPCDEFDSGLEPALQTLADELSHRAAAYRARARSMLTGILLLLYRASLVRPELRNGDGLRLGAVLDHIENNYADELRLSDLAELMGTSPAYFSRLFRSEVGMPAFEYINRTRIRKACLLLRRPELSVTRIALDVGYNSVSFFNRYFRRIMNRTPREYRRFLSS